ncbi:MAG: winged helix-turn-helix domain-containing protein [Desulfobulbus sp.]|nr:winged helix-turn-helix domain-containing protein [Desulfobulbus sp.]
MARQASGEECIEAAYKLLKSARTANDLRLAQAVLLPLEMGLSLEQTAKIIGLSKGRTSSIRTQFAQICAGLRPAPRSKRMLRNRAKANLEREKQVLDEVLATAAMGGTVVVSRIKPEVETRLGKPMALSTLYRMLARHGWRKTRPDTQHLQGDSQVWELLWRIQSDQPNL